jgi:polar amino acid transport system permease protein
METLLAAAVIYWMLSIIFEFVQYRLEAKFGRSLASSHH